MTAVYEHNIDHDGVAHVHVDNIHEIVVRTEEVEAGHFSSQSFILPPAGNVTPQVNYNQNVPAQILALDPLRKRAVISINGTGQCFMCHSQAQAQSLQFGPTQNADEAALITAPFAFTAEATGPLWAVLATTAVIGLSAPTFATSTGAANATTTLTIPAAGASLSDIIQDLNVTFSAASLNATTLTVQSGADILYQTSIASGATSFDLPSALAGILEGLQGQTIVITVTAAGAAITSTVNTTYQAQTSTPGAVTVGVLQERRTC